MWKWLIATLVIAAMAIWGWTRYSEAAPVHTASIRTGDMETYVLERAVTRLPEIFVIATPFEGRILPVTLVEGDPVAAGQIVAQMKTDVLDARIAEQRAAIERLDAQLVQNDDDRLEITLIEQINALLVSIDRAVETAEERTRSSSARAEFLSADRDRVAEAYGRGAATERELEQAELSNVDGAVSFRSDQLALRAAEAIQVAARIGPRFISQIIERKALSRAVLERQREEASARLTQFLIDADLANVPSPVDGVVLRRFHFNERTLAAGEPILEIGRLDEIEVEIEMLTEDASTVSIGDDVEMTGDALGPATVTGKVTRIYPEGFTKISSLGVEQQRVLVIVSIPSEADSHLAAVGRTLGSEYRVQARIITESFADAVIAPRAAVFRRDGERWGAFVVRQGRARRVDVHIGALTDEEAQILGGLQPGDTVVLAPPSGLNDGDRVRPRD